MARSKNFAARGLSSLSSTDADFEALFARHGETQQTAFDAIPVERIRPNPFQARRTFDNIAELANAIREQGFITRLRVRPDPAAPGYYQLVFGERRLRAAIEAGMRAIPCEIAPHTDAAMIEIGLAENIQRQALSPMEEAHSFRTLIDQRGYTHAGLAERIGKDRSYVEDRLALLRAPEDVQALVAQRPDTVRAAREIAKIARPEAREQLIAGVAAGNLSQHAVRALVREATLDEQGDGGARGAHQEAARDAPGPTRSTQAPRPTSASAFEQALARDADTLRTICARWRQAVPRLTSTERNQLAAHMNQHLAELERIGEALQHEPGE